ncbi:hypothetical protein [Novosphingobium sp. PhB57]|jgi:hypothetical protein|uniref:hypothetical protein n=1 Tax=Novosphingobium sp. PhB57 TaxID=2485107 RepID=UPI001050815C|nr:hypothetical protein [Novosphingobium sp. PhB57]
MSEQLFTLLRQERKRLERAIAKAEAEKAHPSEVKRMKVLHRIVNEQICSWMRDLYGTDPQRLKQAA